MKENYRHIREEELKKETATHWLKWNLRYIQTYRQILDGQFYPPILDLGCGTDDFSRTCRQIGLPAEGIDVDRVDFEKDPLPYPDHYFGAVHFNAVMEHIRNPDHILKEIHRILIPRGILIVNTPNWQMDFKNFYNDPTHVKPYTPQSMEMVLKMYGFKIIFLGPALIGKPIFYWKLPNFIKWKLASWIRGGSKSILCLCQK